MNLGFGLFDALDLEAVLVEVILAGRFRFLAIQLSLFFDFGLQGCELLVHHLWVEGPVSC